MILMHWVDLSVLVNLIGWLNDMWKYDLVSGSWMHMSGNQTTNTRSYFSVYPGGVQNHEIVMDGTDSYIYLFGGEGYDTTGQGIDMI